METYIMSTVQTKAVDLLEPLDYVGEHPDPNKRQVAATDKNAKALIKTINNVLKHSRNNMQQTPANVAMINSKIKSAAQILVPLITAGIKGNVFQADSYKVLTAKMRNFGSDNARVNAIIQEVLNEEKAVLPVEETFSQAEVAAIIAEPTADEPAELILETNDGGFLGFNKRLNTLTAYVKDEAGRLKAAMSRKIEGAGTWREKVVGFLKRVFHMVVTGIVLGTLYVASKLVQVTNYLSGDNPTYEVPAITSDTSDLIVA